MIQLNINNNQKLKITEKKIHGFTWIRRPHPPWFCLTQAWISQNQRKNVKHSTNWAIEALAEKSPKLKNTSIYLWNSLQKALKSNFWPISCWFLLERPLLIQSFWKNATFIIKQISGANRSSTFKMAFLAVFLWILE